MMFHFCVFEVSFCSLDSLNFIFLFRMVSGISLGNDPDGQGCPVKGIIESGTIKKDGRIQINDRIVSIGDENLRNGTIQQARTVLRKAAMQDEV